MKFSDCFDLYGESVSSIGTTKHSYIQEKPIVRKDSYCHLSKISNILFPLIFFILRKR